MVKLAIEFRSLKSIEILFTYVYFNYSGDILIFVKKKNQIIIQFE